MQVSRLTELFLSKSNEVGPPLPLYSFFTGHLTRTH
jgi:hypothetical protein